MKHHLCAVTVLMAACQSAAPDDLAWDDPAGWGATELPAEWWDEPAAELPDDAVPPPLFDLVVSQIVGGTTARATAYNLPANKTVSFGVSFTGTGNGPCPPAFNGECLDITNPYLLGTARSNRRGYATFTYSVPNGVIPPGATLYVQAVVTRPNSPAALSDVAQRMEGGMACPANYAPVCGVNGQTFGNACEANVAGWPVASNGPC